IIAIIIAIKTKHNEPVETVEFYPPNGISPAEVGTIIDESADDIDLMSLIPWWAQKGYITLEEIGEKRKKHLVLHKNNSLPENAPAYQKKLFSAFFGNGNTCDLKDLKLSFAERFKESRASLRGVFSGDKKLSVGHGKSILMVILTTLAFFSTLAFSSVVSTFENIPLAIFAAVPMLFFALVTLVGFRGGFRNFTGKIVGVILAVICLIVSLFATYICSIDCVLPMYVPFIALGLSVVSYLFSARIITDTDYRVEMLGKLLGLKNFIETAELDRLKMMMEENPYYYYDVLPYAMVFGLVDKWAKAFTNIKVDVPYWYTGYDTMSTWELLYLNRMLHSSIREPISRINAQAAAKAAASAAANSSSGGFSGGGGGGGGIGSW
ncbi:MAG: DUF2207 domain-containing protein, partial [Ruminococcus sp.]|nr:DUF2207 domain-containing protein [Ruminococcus sp.]